LPNGKILEIIASGVSDRNRYVKSVKLNGKPYDKLYITHADLLTGGKLEFMMASTPNKSRGVKSGKPYSLSD
jgi:putative alpha-1,2-mannosidase